MTDEAMTSDSGAFEGTSPAPARTNSPAPTPARTSSPGQAERDQAGERRWNSPTGRQWEDHQLWNDQQNARHTQRPGAQQEKPDQAAAAKPADGAAAETSHKFGDTTVTEAELQEFLSNKGAAKNGQTKVSLTPDGYALDLPADLQLPAGVEFALNKADPAMAQLRGLAHKYQMPQEAVSDLLGLFVGHKAGELATGKLAYEAEVGKLGAAGPARIDALCTFLRGQIGDQAQVLTGVRDANGNVRGGTLWSAAVVQAYEALMNKIRGQGAASYTGNGRDMGNHDAGKIAGYDKMSFEQRRFAQDQARQQRGR